MNTRKTFEALGLPAVLVARADARQALVALQAQASDEAFDAVVAYWLSIADLSAGGY
jgi:isocitrate lyase